MSLPFLAISFFALVFTIYDVLGSGSSGYIVVFGMAILLGMLAFFVILTGALGELIFKYGDVDLNTLSSLTQKIIPPISSIKMDVKLDNQINNNIGNNTENNTENNS